MEFESIYAAINKAVERKAYYWKEHIIQRMTTRKISVAEILEILSNYEIIEEYRYDRPFPSYLLVGFSGGRPVHLVIGVNIEDKEIHLITVYIPDDSIWEDNYRRRK